MQPVLPSFFLPPVGYFAMLLSGNAVVSLEESYVKQSYRNRCLILSPNGIQKLIVPVVHTGSRQWMKDVRIAYAEPWQRILCMSVKTAYSRSPYYEYFADELNSILEHRFEFLYELNHALLKSLLQFAGIGLKVTVEEGQEINCYKEGRPVQEKLFRPYNQVFSYKWNFQPNLSIIDLLFNMGRQSQTYLAALNEN